MRAIVFEHYRELFASVRKRPLMYLPRADYASVVAFIMGCDEGTSRMLLTGFREWLVTRVGCGDHLVWWSLAARLTEPVGPKNIREMNPELDARTVETLFELLDEFLALRQEEDGLPRIYAAHEAWIEARRRDHCQESGASTCPAVHWPRPAARQTQP
jgi:hypothetical protein